MKKLPLAILVLALSSFTLFLNAQSLNSKKAVAAKSAAVNIKADTSSMDWVGMMRNPAVNIHDVQNAFYAWYNKKHPEGYKQDKDKDKETLNKGKEDNDDESYELFKRWEWFNLPRTDANGNRPDFNKIGTEYHDYLNSEAGRSSRNQRLTGSRITPNNSWAANWGYIGNTAVPSNSPDGSGYGGNGRVNRLRVMPGSTTTFFACAAAGGLWKTTDGGTTWSTNTDQLGDLTTSDIAINPSKTNIMYLATGDGDGIQSIYPDPATIGVLKSYDGGVTWNTTSLSYTLSNAGANYYSVNEILIDPSDTSVIIAATTMGIYRSANSGSTWTLATGTGSGSATWFHNIAFHPGNSQIVYATTSNIIFGVGGSFYRSLNNGVSWTNITSGLPSNSTAEGMALAVSAADTADVFVLATGASNYDFYGLYVSSNHGTSFTTLASKAGGAPNILGRAMNGLDYGTGQGWYDLTLNVSQTNIDTILVGGINVWETYNEGTSWSLSGYWFTGGSTYVHADNHDIEFMPGSSRTFFVTCDGGVFKTTNEGSTWTNLSHNLEIAQQYCVGPAATVSGTEITGWQDNGTNLSKSPWGQVEGGDGTDCFIDYTNSAIMYAETPGAPAFIRSTNSGTSWSNIDGTISESGQWVTPWLMDPKTNTTLYCGINNVWKTTNSGTNWSAISSWGSNNKYISAVAVDSANVNYIYAATNTNPGGLVELTTNGGTSWSNVTSTIPSPITGIAISSKSPAHVWVTVGGYTSGDHVYYSKNSGTSWTNITGNLPNLPVNCVVYESGTGNGVFVGTDQGVYYNDTTMGTTWQFYNINLPLVMIANLAIWNPIKPTAYFTASPLAVCQGSSVQFTDTTHNSPARQLIAATYGRGTWETAIDSTPRLTWSWTFQGGTPSTSPLQNPSVLYSTAGTYSVTLTVTNSAGSSTVSKTSYITVYTPPAVSITLNNNVSCLGGSNGSATANASSGTTPYTYLWSNAGTSSNQTALSAGDYTVTVTDKHGCTATASVAITQPATGVSVTASVTSEVLCNGGSTGSASSSPSGGATPYTYLWSGGGTNSTKSSLSAGTYTITVTDNGGCTATATVTITQPTALGITIASHTNVNCNGGSTGSATANVATGGKGPYTYLWSGGGGTNLTASNLAAGSYTITAKDNNGCAATASVSLTQPAALAANASITANVSCNGGNNGIASSGPTGGASPYTYSWSGGGTNSTKTGLAAGGYTVTVTDFNGCIATSSVSITQPTTSLGVVANETANTNCNADNGSVSSTPSGGTSPYTYLWTGGSTNSTASNLSAGTYTITVTDNHGCTSSASATVTQVGATITESIASQINENCNGGTTGGATANPASGGASPYTYNWTPTGGTNLVASNLSAGVYTITATDNNGCNGSASVDITQPATPLGLTIASQVNVNCNGGTGSATANAATGGTNPYTYSWSGGGGTNLTASNLAAGSYTITAEDNHGCLATASVSITQPATSLGVTIASQVNVSCNGGNTGSATANVATGGTNPYMYSWSGGGGTNLTASNLAAGSYTITTTDNHGCLATASVSITQPASVLGITIASQVNVGCNGGNTGSATANAATGGTNPYTYSWSGGGGTNLTASNLAAGSYTITATDNHGCAATASVSITQPASALGITIASHTNANCNGGANGSATANAATGGTNPYTYSWSGGGGTNLTASNLTAGSYTITATDNHGCLATASVSITQPATSLGITIASNTNENCNGGSNASATANVATGGTNPYTYSWSGGGGTNLTASNLTAGSYTITATDNHGCLATASVSITQPAITISITIASQVNVNCNGGTGSATANAATGGTSPYTYLWSGGGGTNLTASSLAAGSYTITATDNHGCLATASVSITQPASALGITIASHTNVACNGGTGSATANTATGGTSPYTYSWSGGGGTNLIASNLAAGSYTITAEDNHGCLATASVSITQPATSLGVTIASHTNENCNGGSSASATANAATGGTNPYTYSWSGGGGTNLTASNLTAGSYTITAEDNHGCLATASVSITQPVITISITMASHTNENCNGGSNASATANAATGGTSPYTYLWSGGGGTNLTASGLAAGGYTITATDNHGCAATASVSITQPSVVSVGIASQINVNCNGGANGSATASAATGGTNPYTYSWSGGGGTNLTASGLAAGSYTITAEDNHGCLATASVSITQPATALGVTIASQVNVNCNGGNTGSATANAATGGTSPYTYSWSGGGGNALTASNLAAGSYTVTAEDNHGCLATASVSVTQPATALGVTANSTTNVSCLGGSDGSVSSNPTGGTNPYTYSWNGGGSNSTKTGLAAGSYTITVTDNHGCVATASVSVSQPATSVSVTASATANVSCLGGSNGTVSSSPSGGTSPYTYSWNVGGSNSTKTGLTAGTYTITVTDNHGCVATASVSVTQPATSVGITASAAADVSCLGGNNGSVSSTPSGGTSPYSYLWNGGGTNSTKTGLTAGSYTVTVTDNKGCTATASVSLTQPATAVSVSMASHTNILCNGSATGSATATAATGGTGPYVYNWTPNGGTNLAATNLIAGIYTITATDNNGCKSTATATITQPAALVVVGDSVDVSGPTCNGKAWVTVSGGEAPYTYSWSPGGATKDTIKAKCTGEYCCTVTDNNGCTQNTCVVITNSTGVANLSNASDINIYPDPNLGTFTVAGITPGEVIEVYSDLGQKLTSAKANKSTMYFDISNRANGVYLVRILDKDGNTVTQKKIIKAQ